MSIQWFPGHMAKTRRLLKDINKVLDIGVVLLDARCPYSSFSPLIEELLGNKPILLVFTKCDLADKTQTKIWKKHYEEKGYNVICLNLLNDSVTKEINTQADLILKDKVAKELAKGMKLRRMRMVICGIPNVGKSTLINKYSSKKVVNVGNRAGVTKQLQWIRISNKFELLDSPGLLWPKFENEHIGFALAATKAIKNEILPIDDVAIFILKYLRNHYANKLYERYKVDDVSDIVVCYETIGREMHLIKNGNVVDYDRVNERILNDVQSGKFSNITWDNYELLRE
ncbi:MAG: ribosome biogenesis GTPase YlqF [Bacilli bacterium]